MARQAGQVNVVARLRFVTDAKGFAGQMRGVAKAQQGASKASAQHARDLNRVNERIKQSKPLLEYMDQILKRVAIAWLSIMIVRRVTNAIGDFSARLITMNTELDSLQIRLVTLYGTTEKAEEGIAYLKYYALYTPFIIRDLFDAAVALRGFNVSIYENMEAVGDWAAAVGDDVKNTAASFGKIVIGSARTALLLSTRGLNIDIYNRYIEVYKDRTAALAAYIEDRFGGMAKNVAHTFEGILSNIKDAMDLIAAEVGIRLYNMLKATSAGWQDLLRQILRTKRGLDEISYIVRDLVRYGGPALIGIIVMLVARLVQMGKAVTGLSAAIRYVTLTHPWIALLGVISAVVTYMALYRLEQQGIIAQEKEWREVLGDRESGEKSRADALRHLIEMYEKYRAEMLKGPSDFELIWKGILTPWNITKLFQNYYSEAERASGELDLLHRQLIEVNREIREAALEQSRFLGKIPLTEIIKYAKEGSKEFKNMISRITEGLREQVKTLDQLQGPGEFLVAGRRVDPAEEKARLEARIADLQKINSLVGNEVIIKQHMAQIEKDIQETGAMSLDQFAAYQQYEKWILEIQEDRLKRTVDYIDLLNEIAKLQRGELTTQESIFEITEELNDLLQKKVDINTFLSVSEAVRKQLLIDIFGTEQETVEEAERIREIQKRILELVKELFKYRARETKELEKQRLDAIKLLQSEHERNIAIEKARTMLEKGYISRRQEYEIEQKAIKQRLDDIDKEIQAYRILGGQQVEINKLQEEQANLISEYVDNVNDLVRGSFGIQLLEETFRRLGTAIADYVSRLLFSTEEAERVASLDRQIEDLQIRLEVIRGEREELTEEERILQRIGELQEERNRKMSVLKDIAQQFYQDMVRTIIRMAAEATVYAIITRIIAGRVKGLLAADEERLGFAIANLAVQVLITRELRKQAAAVTLIMAGMNVPGAIAGWTAAGAAGMVPILGAQRGWHGWVSQPTLFIAGEKGRERVDVSPQGKEMASTVNVNFYGDVYGTDEFSERVDEAIRMIKKRRA